MCFDILVASHPYLFETLLVFVAEACSRCDTKKLALVIVVFGDVTCDRSGFLGTHADLNDNCTVSFEGLGAQTFTYEGLVKHSLFDIG